VSILIRTAGDPAALALTAQREIAREDKDLPASDVRPMEEKLRGLLAAPRQAAAFFGGFALLAVVLAMLGIYGVLSYAVSTRTREIGIRMALGASPAGVLRLILGDSLRRAAAGIAIGGAAAFFGIHATDPRTLAVASLVIAAVALAAAWIPASRAAGVDPMTAVRTE
jgi:putative ABC transport system permease protein